MASLTASALSTSSPGLPRPGQRRRPAAGLLRHQDILTRRRERAVYAVGDEVSLTVPHIRTTRLLWGLRDEPDEPEDSRKRPRHSSFLHRTRWGLFHTARPSYGPRNRSPLKWMRCVGVSCAPDLGLPRNPAEVTHHNSAIRESRDVDQPRSRFGEHLPQLVVPLRVDRAMTGDGFNQQEPVLLPKIQHHVRYLSVLIDRDSEVRKALLLEVADLVASIPDVDDLGRRREPWGRIP